MMLTATLLQAVFSLMIVIGLILLTAWLFRWWQKHKPSFPIPNAAPSRLGIVETLSLDFRRKLVLIRRDNVLHLLLCGEGQDTVIETQIPTDDAKSSPDPIHEN